MSTSVAVTLPRITVAAENVLLSVTRLRDFVATTLSDASLQAMLDRAFSDIAKKLGPAGVTTEHLTASGPLLMLSRRALGIASIARFYPWTGSTLTLATDDYELSTSGRMLRRLRTGTNPALYWGEVWVTYTPEDDSPTRVMGAVDLVRTEVAYSGYTSESTQSESRGFGDLAKERQAILEALVDHDPAVLV
jgi:hypothetical protein